MKRLSLSDTSKLNANPVPPFTDRSFSVSAHGNKLKIIMSLQLQIDNLFRQTQLLLNLGLNGSPIYSDRFCELNIEVYRLSESLFPFHGSSADEEASLCHALLCGYYVMIYDHGDKNNKVQFVFDRCWHLPTSLLKSQLLVACYGEVFDEDLVQEAHTIIESWKGQDLTTEELEMMRSLKNLEDNPWSNWGISE